MAYAQRCVAAPFEFAIVRAVDRFEPQACSDTTDFVVVSMVVYYRMCMDLFPYVSPILTGRKNEKSHLPGLDLGKSSSMSTYIHILFQAYSMSIGFSLEMYEKILISRLGTFS